MSHSITCRLCLNVCEGHTNIYNENGAQNKDVYDIATKYFPSKFLTAINGTQCTVMCSKCMGHITIFNLFYNSVIWAQQNLLHRYKHGLESVSSTKSNLVGTTTLSFSATQSVIEEYVLLRKELEDCERKTSSSTVEQIGTRSNSATANKDEDFMVAECELDSDSSSDIEFLELPDQSKSTELEIDKKHRLKDAFETSKLSCSPELSNDSSQASLNEDTTESVEYEEPVGVFEGGEFSNTTSSHQSEVAKLDQEVDTSEQQPHEYDTSISGTTLNRSRETRYEELNAIIAKWRKTLSCYVCHGRYSNFMLLREHFLQNHPDKQCYIQCCNRDFLNRSKLAVHATFHLDPQLFTCDLCAQTLSSPYSLKRHRQSYHSDDQYQEIDTYDPPYVDDSCISGSQKRSQETRYEELNASIAKWRKTLSCYVCHGTYSNFMLLREHFSQHHPDKQCYIRCCNRDFQNRSKLAAHATFHMDPQLFTCDLCAQTLSSQYSLKRHRQSYHSDDQYQEVDTYDPPYVDDSCISGSQKRSQETRYEELNASIAKWRKKLSCYVCHGRYSNFMLLRKHFSQHHPYKQCYIRCCNRNFLNRSKLAAHATFHMDPQLFTCDLCAQTLSSQYSLKRHRQSYHSDDQYQEVYPYDPPYVDNTSISGSKKRSQSYRSEELDNDQYQEVDINDPPYVDDTCILGSKKRSPSYRSEELDNDQYQEVDPYDPPYVDNTSISGSKKRSQSYRSEELDNDQYQEVDINDPPYVDDTCILGSKKRSPSYRSEELDNDQYQEVDPYDPPYVDNTSISGSKKRSQSYRSEELDNDQYQEVGINDPPYVDDTFILGSKKRSPSYRSEELDNDQYQEVDPYDPPYVDNTSISGSKKRSPSYRSEELDNDQYQEVDINDPPYVDDTCISGSKKHNREIHYDALNTIIAKWQKKLSCYVCHGRYANFMLLREHFSQHHPGKQCYIRCCNRVFPVRNKLAEHANLHLNPQFFKCVLCARTCATQSSLKRHRLGCLKQNQKCLNA